MTPSTLTQTAIKPQLKPQLKPQPKPELKLQLKPKGKAWYRPMLSPEQGVILVLVGSFLTGAALAQHWTSTTTLALICAFFALQAEYPLMLQIKQRRRWKPRLLVWGGLYGAIALAIALGLGLQSPLLFGIYLMTIVALTIDGICVYYKKQKSIFNELNGFAAICLSAPLAYVATTGELSGSAIAIWVLNTLFFGSAVFTFKLRKKKTSSPVGGVIYHGIATVMIVLLYGLNLLSLVTALSFGVALLKFAIICWQQGWYCQAKFHVIAVFETRFALVYIAIAAISVLPAHLPSA